MLFLSSRKNEPTVEIPLSWLLIIVLIAGMVLAGLLSFAINLSDQVARLERSEQLYIQSIQETWEAMDVIYNRIMGDQDADGTRLRIGESFQEVPNDY